MRRINFVLYFLIFYVGNMIANDGSFYLSGNQLIPITESDIKVTKEVLNITREDDYIYVEVDYTFYNPGKDKTILVGFEANSPSGGVSNYPKNGEHPYMENFEVLLNNSLVRHNVSIVDTENYYIHNRIKSKTVREVTENQEYMMNADEVDFFYVYHFEAKFKKGKNKLIHTYRYRVSSDIMMLYYIDYVLTAATRWANRQIDDFTLNIKMGDGEIFNIKKSFFSSKNEWVIDDGTSVEMSDDIYSEYGSVRFVTYTGGITFRTKNFKPENELYIFKLAMPDTRFDASKDNLPSQIYTGRPLFSNDPFSLYPPLVSIDEKSYKILRNLPFAIKGYVFNNQYIQAYYDKQKWYKPNPNYKPTTQSLTQKEREWIKKVDYYKFAPYD